MRRRKSSFMMVLKVAFVVFGTIFVVGFSYNFRVSQERDTQLARLEAAFNSLRAAMNVDSVRQFHIQKIIAMIDRLNPNMEASLKYDIANEIYNMSQKYPNLDVDLIAATITQETGGTWDPTLISPSGAIGLMQIMPMTGMYVARYEGITWTDPETILSNPIYNIRIGCRYLSSLIERYGLEGGLAAYNGGERRAAAWLSEGKKAGLLPKETENYVPSVLKLYRQAKEG